jgi:hypothetical protein
VGITGKIVSDGLGNTLDKLPPWAVPATAAVVVGLLLLRGNSGGSAGGATRVYTPTPADPNLVALAQTEVGARTEAFNSITGAIAAQHIADTEAHRDVDIVGISSNRDIQLGTIQAGLESTRVAAQLEAARVQDATRRALGLAQTEAEYNATIDTNRTQSTLGLAALSTSERLGLGKYASDEAIATTQANTQTAVATTQANTQTAVAKTQASTQKNKDNKSFWASLASTAVGIIRLFV